MSELKEIRRALDDIRAVMSATATDVRWIKEGMQRGTARMDGHETRLQRMESRLNWLAGVGAVLGSVLGAAVTAIFGWLSRHT